MPGRPLEHCTTLVRSPEAKKLFYITYKIRAPELILNRIGSAHHIAQDE